MRLVFALKAAFAAAAGLYITFAQNHSAAAGLVALVGFAIPSAIAAITNPKYRNLPEALVLIISGIAAAVALFNQEQLQSLKLIVLLMTAAIAVVSVFKNQDRYVNSAINLLAALIFVFFQLDEVSTVGFFGAYLIITCVHFAISATSPTPADSAK